MQFTGTTGFQDPINDLTVQTETLQQQLIVGTERSSKVFLLTVAVFPLLFAAALTLLIKAFVPFNTIGASTRFASITLPINNSSVDRHYQASGTINHWSGPGHLFIVEHNAQGFYPKAPVSSRPGNWQLNLYTGTQVNTAFKLSIVAVNDRDRDNFFAWFDAGERAGNYPAIESVPSLKELSTVVIRVND